MLYTNSVATVTLKKSSDYPFKKEVSYFTDYLFLKVTNLD